MVFSSILFLFRFMPIAFLVYYLVPRKLRNVVILCASLLFYYWGERTYVAIMFLSTAIDYTHGMLVTRCKERGNDKGARMAVASSVVFNLGLLFFFKYWDFLAGSINAVMFQKSTAVDDRWNTKCNNRNPHQIFRKCRPVISHTRTGHDTGIRNLNRHTQPLRFTGRKRIHNNNRLCFRNPNCTIYDIDTFDPSFSKHSRCNCADCRKGRKHRSI